MYKDPFYVPFMIKAMVQPSPKYNQSFQPRQLFDFKQLKQK